jgi:hypothetical protein
LYHKEDASNSNQHLACILGDLKYIFVSPGTHFLFDLSSDPGENRNLYAEEPSAAQKLAANLFAYEKTCPRYNSDYVDIELDKKTIEQLRSLGYVR